MSPTLGLRVGQTWHPRRRDALVRPRVVMQLSVEPPYLRLYDVPCVAWRSEDGAREGIQTVKAFLGWIARNRAVCDG